MSIFPYLVGKRMLRIWGFYDFLTYDLQRCNARRDVGKKLFCDLVNNDGALDMLEDVYAGIMEFLGHPQLTDDARKKLVHISRSPFHDRADQEHWFDDNIP